MWILICNFMFHYFFSPWSIELFSQWFSLTLSFSLANEFFLFLSFWWIFPPLSLSWIISFLLSLLLSLSDVYSPPFLLSWIFHPSLSDTSLPLYLWRIFPSLSLSLMNISSPLSDEYFLLFLFVSFTHEYFPSSLSLSLMNIPLLFGFHEYFILFTLSFSLRYISSFLSLKNISFTFSLTNEYFLSSLWWIFPPLSLRLFYSWIFSFLSLSLSLSLWCIFPSSLAFMNISSFSLSFSLRYISFSLWWICVLYLLLVWHFPA